MEVSQETIKRDLQLVKASFAMNTLLNNACADQAVIARVERHLTNPEQKKLYQKVLDKLDYVTRFSGLYLDSDEELTNLSPGLHSEISLELNERILKLVNNQLALVEQNTSDLMKQYIACHSAARAIIMKTNQELSATIKMHHEKFLMISAEQPSEISTQDKAKNLNDSHKTIIKYAQEVSDSLSLQTTLKQAYAHFNLPGETTSPNESEQLIEKFIALAQKIKENFFEIYKKALHEILVDKRRGRNQSKKQCTDHCYEHRTEKIEKCANEISTRAIQIKNLLTNLPLCTLITKPIEDVDNKIDFLFDRTQHYGHRCLKTSLFMTNETGLMGLVDTLYFFALPNSAQLAIKKEHLIITDKIKLKINNQVMKLKFDNLAPQTSTLAYAANGDYYISRDGNNFYKVNEIVGRYVFDDGDSSTTEENSDNPE